MQYCYALQKRVGLPQWGVHITLDGTADSSTQTYSEPLMLEAPALEKLSNSSVSEIVPDALAALHGQAMSILRGQLPWRKRQRPEVTGGPASSPVPLRSAMSAPSGAIDSLAPPSEEAADGEWTLTGPYTFDRWRDMIERCAFSDCDA